MNLIVVAVVLQEVGGIRARSLASMPRLFDLVLHSG